MPYFCVNNGMQLILWLLFEKLSKLYSIKNKGYADNNEKI